MSEPASDENEPATPEEGTSGASADSGGRRAIALVLGGAILLATFALWVLPGSESGDADRTAERADTGPATDVQEPTDTDIFAVDAVESVELSGTWAAKSVQTSVTDIPVVGEVEAETITHRRITLEQRGATVELRSELCKSAIQSNSSSVRTVIPDAYIDSAEVQERDAALQLGDRGRLRMRVPRTCGVRGAELSDPAEDELPTEPDDSRVVDGDGDGRPGVTIRVEGTISGRMSLVQRGCDAYEGIVRSRDRIRGTVEWSTEQEVLAANSMLLRGKTAAKPHPNPERSWFVMTRVTESATCEEIVERSAELF